MSRGIQRERDLVNRLREEGWWAIRSPASKGDVDVVAIREVPGPVQSVDHPEIVNTVPSVRFIEVKSTKAGPYACFGPVARQELKDAATLAGATAELCWWPPRKQPRFIPSDQWP